MSPLALVPKGNRHRPKKRTARLWLKLAAFALVTAWVGLTTAERLCLVHANSYPSWLASSPYIPTGPDPALYVHDHLCLGNEPVEVFEKPHTLVLHCGTWWPFARTFVVVRQR